jgi:hypothetical protein
MLGMGETSGCVASERDPFTTETAPRHETGCIIGIQNEGPYLRAELDCPPIVRILPSHGGVTGAVRRRTRRRRTTSGPPKDET